MLQLRRDLAWVAVLIALTQVASAEPEQHYGRDIRPAINLPLRRGASKCHSSAAPSHTPTPTGHPIPSGPDPDEDCYMPTYEDDQAGNVDIDRLCQCSYYDPSSPEIGGVQCWVTCTAYRPEQVLETQYTDSLSSCINACYGSFEKRSLDIGSGLTARQDGWFCHGVNFKLNETCQWFGDIGGYEYTPYETSCWTVPGIGGG
ncbi:hypothetical protein GGR57DRAFT_486239 [Xylariaceae sp. FL1272]|nr:hypothetical protein GGR57DRAFT_486239 [Xylariaceae sp. FL1272]